MGDSRRVSMAEISEAEKIRKIRYDYYASTRELVRQRVRIWGLFSKIEINLTKETSRSYLTPTGQFYDDQMTECMDVIWNDLVKYHNGREEWKR